ncbi:hypothetical protein GC096_16970 [Paenibacillus sp. LMG 31461]|uniref:Uncharacterized protein n=1 Tax=Paenibacillus plantarum TaxID=2654975 RepID=A0ABX1XBE9_9BACL|nr:hypothetical protein [Paenibacillus plantarum]NOU65729.1 hypothetical protein [Paenibacillus plantarum]
MGSGRANGYRRGTRRGVAGLTNIGAGRGGVGLTDTGVGRGEVGLTDTRDAIWHYSMLLLR